MRMPPSLLALLAGALFAGAAMTQPQQNGPAPAPPVEPVRYSIAIKNRKVDASVERIRVAQGDVLELEFTSDERAELHLHGYDELVTVAPGVPAVLRLDANIAGRFSIEAHNFAGNASGRRASARSHEVLLYLEVYPR